MYSLHILFALGVLHCAHYKAEWCQGLNGWEFCQSLSNGSCAMPMPECVLLMCNFVNNYTDCDWYTSQIGIFTSQVSICHLSYTSIWYLSLPWICIANSYFLKLYKLICFTNPPFPLNQIIITLSTHPLLLSFKIKTRMQNAPQSQWFKVQHDQQDNHDLHNQHN